MPRRKYIDLAKRPDHGYLPHSTHNWWFDADEPDAFEMFDLDGFYSNRYYRADHVHRLVVEVIVTALLAVVRDTLGRDVHSVLDLGCGAGQFTKAFLDGGIDTTAVEGSKAGVARAVQRGVPGSRLLRHDLRLPLRLERRFDMVMCTEIAEHIEPPFSSQLIHTISEHSDVCWFSSEPPGTNQDHLHHCNEQPDVFWINLFRFYGFQALPISIDVQLQEGSTVEQFCREQAALRGRYVFIRSGEDLTGQQAAVLVSADETGALSACAVTT